MSLPKIYYPETPLPFPKLLPLGLQHVIAMFGATILAPLLMGFHPQTAIFFSGIGTLIFIIITKGKVPSYLGSSFAFIGPVLAVTSGNHINIPFALFGMAGAALLYTITALMTIRFGTRWLNFLIPPIVSGSVVTIIGLNLAASVINNITNSTFAISSHTDFIKLTIAVITFLTTAYVAVFARGFLKLIPFLCGVIVGYLLSFFTNTIDPIAYENIKHAAWFGLPHFQTPQLSLNAFLIIAPVFLVLLIENKGHLEAISHAMNRNLSPYLGRAYLGDSIATLVSVSCGGTPQTTYAENMGVMAMTKIFSISVFVMAAVVAIMLGLCPKFGALIQSIPNPVLGGVALILYGIITLMGIKIWFNAKLDLTDNKNLIIAAASLILATGLGLKGITIGGINFAGITVGTVFAVVINLLLSLGQRKHKQD